MNDFLTFPILLSSENKAGEIYSSWSVIKMKSSFSDDAWNRGTFGDENINFSFDSGISQGTK